MTLFFDKIDISNNQKTFNHATLSVRSNFLGRRSIHYPGAKERFADFHIERTPDGFITSQRFFAGTIENKHTPQVKTIATKLTAGMNGIIGEEISCLAVSTDQFRVVNIEAAGFLDNVRNYLKALDGRYFLAKKIRDKFTPRSKVRKEERRKRKQTRKLATLARARLAKEAVGDTSLPWFKRSGTTKVASGW
jgi:hypothetical protein